MGTQHTWWASMYCILNVDITTSHADSLTCDVDGIWEIANLITYLKTEALILFLDTGLGVK